MVNKKFCSPEKENHNNLYYFWNKAFWSIWDQIISLMFCSVFYCFKLKSKKYIERLIDPGTLSCLR